MTALAAPTLAPIAGFRAAAVAAGLRRDGRADVGVVVADRPATVAGVLTRNRVRAAPVDLTAQRLAAGTARAVLVNSGGANACTGSAGWEAALRTTAGVASALGCSPEEVLAASTGVIGQVLDAGKVVPQLAGLVGRAHPGGLGEFALAMCTTDRWPKARELEVPTPLGPTRWVLMGKGAGMIHPDLGLPAELPGPGGVPQATMLAFVLTDAILDPETLAGALARSAERTLNLCSVDGDTSTNDTVLVLGSGASGRTPSDAEVDAALDELLGFLAREMVRDGEGSEHVVEVVVRGLETDDEARLVARTVAGSSLVKTALYGRDANWGRLLAAAGRAGVAFDPRVAIITLAGVRIVEGGVSRGAEAEAEAQRRMAEPSLRVELELGQGPGRASYLTSDLGHGYIDVNASYRS